MKAPKSFRDVYYWPSHADAKEWAARNGWPTDRIFHYGRGWAVQVSLSGSYAGPGDEKTPRPFRGTAEHRYCAECGKLTHPDRLSPRNGLQTCRDCADLPDPNGSMAAD